MGNTLDMQTLRHLNLFSEITRIHTRFCFNYNNILFFCVPKEKLSKAIGEAGKNVKKINYITKKQIRIIPLPNSLEDLKSFVESIIAPITFKEISVEGNEIKLNAGRNSKAALIGRNKRRLLEMQKIMKDFFGKEFKII
jgi:transcription antitermination factor NusA-like protein